MNTRFLSFVAFTALSALPGAAMAQSLSVQEQARLKAEREAAERARRSAEPLVTGDAVKTPTVGVFPAETPCFPLRSIVVEGVDRPELRWAPVFLGQYRGRCAGPKGLDHILRALQAAFLDRGLVTTRAGIPEQNLSSGTLRVVIIPGVVSGIETNGKNEAAAWHRVAPVQTGDLVDLRAVEQGLEQLRRVPGQEATIDLKPGDRPGTSVLALSLRQRRSPIGASVSINNFASRAVGQWQASGQISAYNPLGHSDLLVVGYRQRLAAPALPADSRGAFVDYSIPFGWWTLGANASMNRDHQMVQGQVSSFRTRGRMDQVSLWADRTIARDQTSVTAARVQLVRRWSRNYIDDIEIGIQRQDISDLEIGLRHRRSLKFGRLDAAVALRSGLGLFGAQEETLDRPRELPSARYRVLTTDVSLAVPLGQGFFESWRADFHSQYSAKNLYGSDAISVGGPYTVRGFDSETAEIGRTGFFLRQEIGLKVADGFRPYSFFDTGAVKGGSGLIGGAGGGLRVYRGPISLDAFAALPVFGGYKFIDKKHVRFGLSASMGI